MNITFGNNVRFQSVQFGQKSNWRNKLSPELQEKLTTFETTKNNQSLILAISLNDRSTSDLINQLHHMGLKLRTVQTGRRNVIAEGELSQLKVLAELNEVKRIEQIIEHQPGDDFGRGRF